MIWNSFKPTMVSDLWANSATSASNRDIRRLKMAREKDAMGDMEQSGDLARSNAAAKDRRDAIDQEKRTAPIEGEPGDMYQTRMQNQAWDPDSYGNRYRSQFKSQEPSQSQSGIDEEAEARRKRRLSMAMAGSDY